MKSYTEQFSQIDTIAGLFDFRDKLKEDVRNNDKWADNGVDTEKLEKCQEANWHLSIVEKRIEYLIRDGESLDKIREPKPELSPMPQF